MSGSFREISFWRSSILRLMSTSGYRNDAPHSSAIATRAMIPWKSEREDERGPHDHRHDPEELHHEDLVDVEVRRTAREHELVRRCPRRTRPA